MNSKPNTYFLEIARRFELVSQTDADAIDSLAKTRGMDPRDIAIEQGYLDAVQIDMVDVFRHANDAIPGYEILSVLGRGGMGVVYKARQTALDRIVAVKTILVSMLQRPGVVGRFEKEAQVVARLRHPNIVTAFDFGRSQGRIYLVMEYMEGEDLEKLIVRRGPLDERTVWHLIRQAAAGLAHGEEHHVVHRDIKPANLYLVAPPSGYPMPAGIPLVKLMDFGLAFLEGSQGTDARLTQAGSSLGTPYYMAPEQIDNSEVDCRADIYALGATAYHCLTANPPYAGQTIWDTIARKSSGEQLELDGLASVPGVRLLTEMLAHDPAKRISNYRALLNRIDELATDNLVQSRPAAVATSPTIIAQSTPTLVISPSRTFRKHGKWWLPASAAVVISACGFYLAYQYASDRKAIKPPQTKTTINSRLLFNGESLKGWSTKQGAWFPTTDREMALVLAGQGVVSTTLPAYQNFRITLGVDLHEAAAIEVHFGLCQGDNGLPRNLLRISRDEILLGELGSGDTGFTPKVPVMTMARSAKDKLRSSYREIRVERHPTRWWVYYDGKLIGHVPVRSKPEQCELWLVSEGGTAYFENIEIAELAYD